jgi:hypothetical protein
MNIKISKSRLTSLVKNHKSISENLNKISDNIKRNSGNLDWEIPSKIKIENRLKNVIKNINELEEFSYEISKYVDDVLNSMQEVDNSVAKKLSSDTTNVKLLSEKQNINATKSYKNEEILRNELNKSMDKDLNFVEKNKNIGFNSTDESIDIILDHDKEITEASEKYNVPKEVIQAVMLKELRMKDGLDVVSDTSVDNYFAYQRAMENYSNLPAWQKAITPVPQPSLPMKEDSSTGPGQIFIKTVIEAEKEVNENEIDSSDWKEREKIWNELKNDEKNIDYMGLVLKSKAQEKGIDLSNATDEEIETVIASYNGSGDAAAEYGEEVKGYSETFYNYNNPNDYRNNNNIIDDPDDVDFPNPDTYNC